MDRKLLMAIMVSLLLGITGCNDSNKNGVTSAPRKKWVDIRGTEVIVKGQSGAKICVAVPNGVSAVNHNNDMTITFEDFNDFSDSSVKYPIDYKVGVSSVFIYPLNSDELIARKKRFLELGMKQILSEEVVRFHGFESFDMPFGVKDNFGGNYRKHLGSLYFYSTNKSMSFRFFAGKKLLDEYEVDGVIDAEALLSKLLNEVNNISRECTNE